MKQFGFAIIGTGSIVNTYVKCLEELDGSGKAKLVAMFTKSPERVTDVEAQFGVRAYADLDDFLSQPDIDVVCICNESGNHGEAIMAAAKAGKHVLSEKPLEVTPEKIDEIIAICNENDIKLGCVLQNRCGTEYKAMHEAVKKDKLGKLLMGNAHINWYRSSEYYAKNPWRGTLKLDGGAAFMNQGIHTIDLLLNLMGPVASVNGKVKTMVHNIEGEDVGTAMVSFGNGAMGVITGGTALYPGYLERVEVYGEKGSIIMEGGKIVQWNVQDYPKPSFTQIGSTGSGASDPTAITHLNHKEVIEDMIASIQNDRTPMVDGVEAKKAVEAITAIYQSSKEEKPVYL